MKIVIPGGSGHVGSVLAREFARDGHEVVVLSRRPQTSRVRQVQWDAKTDGPWMKELDEADAVINLAGRSVNCRYNEANRREIMDSRVESTAAVGRAILSAKAPPRVWLQSSTATIYSHCFDAPNDDVTGTVGGLEADAPSTWRFSIDVATNWEQAATDFDLRNTRLVLMRSAMTMSPDRGGIFDVLLWLVRRGLGGTSGSGRQYVSWVHEVDFVDAVKWLIVNELAGPVNIASPNPLPNREFMAILRQAWGAKIGLPATEWMLNWEPFLCELRRS